MHTLIYLDARGQRKTLTFYTQESYQVALLMAKAGGLTVIS